MENKPSISIFAEDLITKDIPPRTVWLDPIVQSGILAMVYAYTGVGKTFFCFWLAACLAAGQNFLKWASREAAKVLYIDGEMTSGILQERLIHIAKYANFDVPSRSLEIITPDLCPLGIVPDIASAKGQQIYDSYAENADVVVIDNLNTCAVRKGGESDEAVYFRYAPWLVKLRSARKCVIAVHHAGKGGSQLGTSMKEQMLDWIIKLQRPFDYRAEEGARFDVFFEKGRGFRGADAEPLAVWMRDLNDSIEWQWARLVDKQDEAIGQMKRAGLTAKQISEELHVTLFRVKQVLKMGERSYGNEGSTEDERDLF